MLSPKLHIEVKRLGLCIVTKLGSLSEVFTNYEVLILANPTYIEAIITRNHLRRFGQVMRLPPARPVKSSS